MWASHLLTFQRWAHTQLILDTQPNKPSNTNPIHSPPKLQSREFSSVVVIIITQHGKDRSRVPPRRVSSPGSDILPSDLCSPRCRSVSSCYRIGRGRRGWPSTTSRSRTQRSTRLSMRWAEPGPAPLAVEEDSIWLGCCWSGLFLCTPGASAGRQQGPQVH